MAEVGFEFKGLEELEIKLKKMSSNNNLINAVNDISQDVKNNAVALVHVDTGQLRQSIVAKPAKVQGDSIISKVVAGAEYAMFLEFGTGIHAENGKGRQKGWVFEKDGKKIFTRGSHPYPFMRPAVKKVKASGTDKYFGDMTNV